MWIKLLVLVVSCIALTLAATMPIPGCVHNGKYHNLNTTFQDNPCEPCECLNDGQVRCLVIDCFFVPCVDSVQDPTKCCPECPNGENCKHTDGHIIKKGDVYHPDNHTTCKCPEVNFGFGLSPNAICIAH